MSAAAVLLIRIKIQIACDNARNAHELSTALAAIIGIWQEHSTFWTCGWYGLVDYSGVHVATLPWECGFCFDTYV